jgi:hypothetical protein
VTRYYVDVSQELLAQGNLRWPEGFRLIGRLYDDSRWFAPGRAIERWYVEDDKAAKRLEGMLIEPHFVLDTKSGTVRISKRAIRKCHPLNDM